MLSPIAPWATLPLLSLAHGEWTVTRRWGAVPGLVGEQPAKLLWGGVSLELSHGARATETWDREKGPLAPEQQLLPPCGLTAPQGLSVPGPAVNGDRLDVGGGGTAPPS